MQSPSQLLCSPSPAPSSSPGLTIVASTIYTSAATRSWRTGSGRQGAAECEAWMGVARSHEAVAAGLRATLDQLLQSPCAIVAEGECEAEDTQSCCFEALAAADVNNDDGVASGTRAASSSSCKACGGDEACVLLSRAGTSACAVRARRGRMPRLLERQERLVPRPALVKAYCTKLRTPANLLEDFGKKLQRSRVAFWNRDSTGDDVKVEDGSTRRGKLPWWTQAAGIRRKKRLGRCAASLGSFQCGESAGDSPDKAESTARSEEPARPDLAK